MSITAEKRSRASELADKIRHRLLGAEFSDGDFFMTESQLAEEYGASRSTTREAVVRLRELGILEGRKSKGLMVRRPNPAQLLSRSLPAMARSEEDIKELSNLRYVLEVGAIELAVLRATDEQIERLEQLAQNLDEAITQQLGIEREIEIDLAFHSLILQMTQSPLIAGMQQVLAEYFAHGTSCGNQDDAWEHRAIAAAIRARDVERARSMIRLHFAIEGDGSHHRTTTEQ